MWISVTWCSKHQLELSISKKEVMNFTSFTFSHDKCHVYVAVSRAATNYFGLILPSWVELLNNAETSVLMSSLYHHLFAVCVKICHNNHLKFLSSSDSERHYWVTESLLIKFLHRWSDSISFTGVRWKDKPTTKSFSDLDRFWKRSSYNVLRQSLTSYVITMGPSSRDYGFFSHHHCVWEPVSPHVWENLMQITACGI